MKKIIWVSGPSVKIFKQNFKIKKLCYIKDSFEIMSGAPQFKFLLSIEIVHGPFELYKKSQYIYYIETAV